MRWSILIFAIAAAVLGYFCFDVTFWGAARPALLVALSVIGGAVLVRLARGMPVSNSENFEVDEIRSLAKAVKQVMRSLKALIILAFASIAGLTVIEPFGNWISSLGRPEADVVLRVLSAGLTLVLAYVFARILDVVRGDYDILQLQADYMVRSVERKKANQFSQQYQSPTSTFKTPEGYGKPVQ